MKRDWPIALLAAPLIAVAAGLLAFVDFAHEPRNESIASDFAVMREGCLDWWCRAHDAVPFGIAALLCAAALGALVWGLRLRGD